MTSFEKADGELVDAALDASDVWVEEVRDKAVSVQRQY
jgi:hypothetical protein